MTQWYHLVLENVRRAGEGATPQFSNRGQKKLTLRLLSRGEKTLLEETVGVSW